MRDFGWKVGAAAAVVALLVPAASAAARSSARAQLALLPLPQRMLGAPGSGMTLAHDSGAVSNAAAASTTADATTATLEKLGRVNGYVLDYGDAFDGGAGVTGIRTGVEQYRSAADAKRGLAFWQKEDAQLSALDQPGFKVTNKRTSVPAVGTRSFAYLTSFSASNISPVSTLDEQFVEGRYVLDVYVATGTAFAAKALAPKLAEKLDAQVQLALAGQLHAKPVKLPPQLQPGPPSDGPDLSTLALAKTDLTGAATLGDASYVVDPQALSDFSSLFLPAGPFGVLGQEIEWYPTANEASFRADAANALALHQKGSAAVDLSSLGDGAAGVLLNGSSGGAGQVVFSSGRLAEFLVCGGRSAVQTTDLTAVARAAAAKIDAAGLGS